MNNIMKKTILFLATLLALAIGCQRAEDLSPDMLSIPSSQATRPVPVPWPSK